VNAPGGRYDLREIVARIDRLMRLRNMSPKEVFEEIGMKKADWSKKIHNNESSFTIGELDAIATVLKAPPGWPFLNETQADILERALSSQGAPPAALPPQTVAEPGPREVAPSGQPGRRQAGGRKSSI
jgi:hypothetical protein